MGALAKLFLRVVSLDVHQSSITVCVLIDDEAGVTHIEQRQFGGFKRDRREMAQWILSFNPQIVVMESSGSYWQSPYVALEKVGIKAMVVNARHVKKAPGKKTDFSDAKWLALLARAGLLNRSFIPSAKLRQLRLVSRERYGFVKMLGTLKNRLHHLLSQCGIRLNVVVSDIHGVAARAMVKGIIAGKSPSTILDYAGNRLKASRAELYEAVQGEVDVEHRFLLNEIMLSIEETEARISRLNRYLLDGLAEEEPYLRFLETIPGIDRLGAAMLLVEIGTDMSEFKSADHLSSWAGLCPGNHESAGKRKSGRTRKGNVQVRRLLCEFAHAASRTKGTAFKAKFDSLVYRLGYRRAIVAIGHKILRTIFYMLDRGEPYRDSVFDYEAEMVKKNAPRWIKSLAKYGYLDTALT